MRQRILLVLSLLVSATPTTGGSSDAFAASCRIAINPVVVIDNGSAPPNPDNIVDTPSGWPNLCVQSQTTVAIDPGGVIGGTGEGSVFVLDTSRVDVRGGSATTIFALDSSRITLSDGSVERFATEGGATGLITGGLMQHLSARDNSWIEFWGGGFASTANSDIIAAQDAQIDILGADFAVNGIPIGFGPIPANPNPFGRLTGTLASGQPLDVLFQFEHLYGNTSTINLVFQQPIPEPSTALLLASGLIGLAINGRRLRA
jgi:hypothetical protein